MDSNLLLLFFERQLGRPLDDSVRPEKLSGMDVIAALWPLNDVFRSRLSRISTVKYEERFGSEADDAIVGAVFSGNCDGWDGISAGAWRVLLERHIQALMVAAANEAAGNMLMTVPADSSGAVKRGAAMIFLLHGMKLPWPVKDRSGCELPTGSPTATLRLH